MCLQITFCDKMWIRKISHARRDKMKEKMKRKEQDRYKTKAWAAALKSSSNINTCLVWLLWLPRLFWESKVK